MEVDVRTILVLTGIPGIGARHLKALLDHLPDPQSILSAPRAVLESIPGMDRRSAEAVARSSATYARALLERRADDQLERLSRMGGRVLTLLDGAYPSNLKKISDPPPILFMRGRSSERDSLGIAVVGTRNATPYGLELTARLAGDLARAGLPIVSGLARGVDTAAHLSALEASARTIAVIGSGIDSVYPPENIPLAERIVQSGAVLSECPMHARPLRQNFPRRNRIISGMAIATVVIETATDGGAMITARRAIKEGRALFCTPTPVLRSPRSGTNLLIKQGKAMLVEGAEDILRALAPRIRAFRETLSPTPPILLAGIERQILDTLEAVPRPIELIARRCGLNVSDTLIHLIALELKGAIRELPGTLFARL